MGGGGDNDARNTAVVDPESTHAARHGTAAEHVCHVLIQSHMQMHKTFISIIADGSYTGRFVPFKISS